MSIYRIPLDILCPAGPVVSEPYDSMCCFAMKALPPTSSGKKSKTYIYCTRRIKCFLNLLSGLLIFLVMSISSMWHVAPSGKQSSTFGSDCEANQTKCVCLCSSARLLCVHRRQSEKEYDCGALARYLCFVRCFLFILFLLVLRIICRVSDFLILPSLWDETGGAIAVTKTERLHDGRRRRREMIHSGVFGGVAYLSWEKKTAVMASLCRLSSVPCCLSSGEMNICGPVLILPLCMTQFDFG